MYWKTVSEKRLGNQFVCMSLLMVLLSGCSSLTTQDSSTTGRPSQAEQADCQSISTLFSQSNHGFKTIRTRPSYKHNITLWDTRYQLIENSCQVWQWSDKYRYICNKAYPDQQTAHQVYQQAQEFINHCLGEKPGGWYEKQGVLEGRGEETQYLLEDQVRGSLRKQSTPGLFKNSGSVYFWIDSPSMLR